jgi:hypothetical protein
MGASVSICQSNEMDEQFDLRLLPIPKLVREEPEYFVDVFQPGPAEYIDDWVEYYEFVNNGFKKIAVTP